MPLRPLSLTALCVLAACAGQSTSTQAAVETALTAAEKAATVYAQLPLCPRPGGTLCSDASAVQRIKAADNVAYAGVVDMRAGKVTPEAAAALVASLVALIPVTK